MKQFVVGAAAMAGLVPQARSRRAFLAAVADFEAVLKATVDYPRGRFALEDLEELRALADAVVEHIETRVEARADRAAVTRSLVASIYRIRSEVEAIYTTIRSGDDGNPARNPARTGDVTPSR